MAPFPEAGGRLEVKSDGRGRSCPSIFVTEVKTNAKH
jgi:hypothetical protein